jgi:site-specific DNA-methyltransferase (adenine-specific)
MKLINGCCINELKNIEDNSVDLCILDLPYGTTSCKWDNKIDLDKLWTELKRVGKDNTPFFFFCDYRFSIELYNSNPKWFRYDLIWLKPNSNCGHLNSGKMPMRNHELLLVFYKKLPTYNKDKYHKKINEYEYTKSNKEDSVYRKFYINKDTRNMKIYDIPLPKSVLEYPIENKMSQHKRFHQTQKPQNILEWIIKYYSNENDVILDPTMGGGSSGIACLTLNREFIGIELDKDIFEKAKNRIENNISV